ncbi:BEL1-like homeodomain protein 11 [Macadamia integrifolia]|uniref:BEL1-like homeodomain protein 11 n=1 Tax=Macadamia integrifolia TaxID=60698 RepID=UPI001C50042E|nr:BEL1-like homeodomain protein 11 [Macadamia integrifolia]
MVSQGSSVDPSSVHPFTVSDLDVLPIIQLLGERISRSIDLVQDLTFTEESETCHRRHLMNLLGVANDTDHQQCRRLSLTLGSHLRSPTRVPSTLTSTSSLRYQSCSTSYGPESFATIVGCSRYLKPAQTLLEEVVNVGAKDLESSSDQPFRWLTRNGRRGALDASTEFQGEQYCNGSSTPEEHELKIRIVKLIALLDEVDARYEHYYHQMEEVISSFEVAAGRGASRSYTSLALQAMSRRFSNLRNAIIVQINGAKRELDPNVAEIRNSLSQVGVTQNQNQAWRSMRGLPENSVAILRSWLFEHFLHPYPKDSEKLLLASQTGLTKSQVSNWFINARVRLWKPMIEEMYNEEFAESSSTGGQKYT